MHMMTTTLSTPSFATLPVDALYEITKFTGLSTMPSLLVTCSHMYNSLMNHETSVMIWLSLYTIEVNEQIASAPKEKAALQIKSKFGQKTSGQVLARFEKRRVLEKEWNELKDKYQFQAVYNMCKQLKYSHFVKLIPKRMNDQVDRMNHVTTASELIQLFNKIIETSKQLLEFTSSDLEELKRLEIQRVKMVKNLVPRSSLLMHLLEVYSRLPDKHEKQHVDQMIIIIDTLINDYGLSVYQLNGKRNKSVLHCATSTASEAIVDRIIYYYNLNHKDDDKTTTERVPLEHSVFHYMASQQVPVEIFVQVLNNLHTRDPTIPDTIAQLLNNEPLVIVPYATVPLLKQLINMCPVERQFNIREHASDFIIIALNNWNRDTPNILKEKVQYFLDQSGRDDWSNDNNNNDYSILVTKALQIWSNPQLQRQMVTLLLEAGLPCPPTALFSACIYETSIELIDMLVEQYGVDIHYQYPDNNNNNITIIYRVMHRIAHDAEHGTGLLPILRHLLQLGANPIEFFLLEGRYMNCLRLAHTRLLAMSHAIVLTTGGSNDGLSSYHEIIGNNLNTALTMFKEFGYSSENGVSDPSGMDLDSFLAAN